jgi:acyl-CoA thioesterase-2
MAQALMAASLTVDRARPVHSLHGYFLRPGDPKIPAVIKVERLRDGRSFSSRRVVVVQRGEAIFNMDVSFQIRETGLTHQFPMPELSPPESDDIPDHLYESAFITWRHEFRRLQSSAPQPPEQYVWFKSHGAVPDDSVLQACLLVYESDNVLLGTSRLPHRGQYDPDRMQVASLDHAMWFHEPVDVSNWLLYALDAPSTSAGRGLSRGAVYSIDGALLASTVQEGLIRLH